jgi:hypothetical protein
MLTDLMQEEEQEQISEVAKRFQKKMMMKRKRIPSPHSPAFLEILANKSSRRRYR